VAGLLALMLLTEARRTARVSASGELVTLDEQDRGAWDPALIAEGHRLVRERLAAAAAGVAPGRYQILAAINAVHTSARDIRDTDWSQVVALYDQLVRLDRSPIVAINRAIAVGELEGPEVALATVDRLEDELAGYHAYHATRAALLRRLGRGQESRAAYEKRRVLLARRGLGGLDVLGRFDQRDGGLESWTICRGVPPRSACPRNRSMPSVAQRLLQKRGRLGAETGRNNSGSKNRLARAAKMIGVKPTAAA
jgi:hypothetical protein